MPIRASISLPSSCWPAMVPWPRPYCEARSVEIRFISAAAPGVVGAARTRPLRNRLSLRRVSGLRPGDVNVVRRLGGVAHPHFGADRAEVSGERVGIVGDVGGVDPLGAVVDHRIFAKLMLGTGDEGVGFRHARSGARGRRCGRGRLHRGDRPGGGDAGGHGEGEKRHGRLHGGHPLLLVNGANGPALSSVNGRENRRSRGRDRAW